MLESGISLGGPEAATPVEPLTVTRREPDLTWPVRITMLALCLTGVVLVAVNASMFGDGAWYLLRAVITHRQQEELHGRFGINYVRQGPTLLALEGGVDNLRVLAFLQDVTFILLPVVAWCWAVRLAAARSAFLFGLVVVTCAATFGSMIFFSNSELVLALPLVLCVSMLVESPQPVGRPAVVLGILAMATVQWSHEAMVLPCGIVVGQMALRLVRRRGAGPSRATIAFGVLALTAVVFSLHTRITSPSKNEGYFFDSIVNLLPRATAITMVAGLGLIAWVALPRTGSWRLARYVGLGAIGVLAFIAVDKWLRSGPRAAYEARALSVMFVIAAQLTVMAVGWRLPRLNRLIDRLEPRAAERWLPVGFLALALVVPLGFSVKWHEFTDHVSNVVRESPAVVTPEEAIPADLVKYSWPWTNPTMSLLLRSGTDNGVILNEEPVFWEPFDPSETQELLPPGFTWR